MDSIFKTFLERQTEDGMALARDSDILRLFPLGPRPIQTYRAVFRCRTQLLTGPGKPEVGMADSCILISFHDDYLRQADVAQMMLRWQGPVVWHPNILGPFICIGPIAPGTELVELVHRVYSTISFNNFSLADPLNHAACPWVRDHPELYPTDRRPIKRRQFELRVESEAAEGAGS